MHGFTKSRISYIFWPGSVFPQIIMHRVRAGWRLREQRPLEENTHLLLSSLQFLGTTSTQVGAADGNNTCPTHKAP